MLNDAADVVPTVLVDAAGRGVDAEQLRLLLLTQLSSMEPASLDSCAAYLTTPQRRPISFNLAGVRVTRAWLLGTALSIVSSVTILPLWRALGT